MVGRSAPCGTRKRGGGSFSKAMYEGEHKWKGVVTTDKVLHTVLYHRRTEMDSKKKRGGGTMYEWYCRYQKI